MTDVLLIEPYHNDEADDAIRKIVFKNSKDFPPVGLACLAAMLKREAITVRGLDLSLQRIRDLDIVGQQVRKLSPAIIGISISFAFTANYGYRLIAYLKKTFPAIKVVVGGNHATYLYDEVLEAGADVVVKFEGEYTFLELCQLYLEGKTDISGVLGIAYIKDGQIVTTALRPLIQNLDDLPFPDYSIFGPYDNYKLSNSALRLVILSSRGCPYRCIFCSTSSFARGKIRFRSIDNTIDEIKKRLAEYQFQSIFLADDNFNTNEQRLLEICRRLKTLNIPWHTNIHVKPMTKAHLQAMKDSHCELIRIGVESANHTVLEGIKKSLTIEKCLALANWCQELGIKLVCGFMFPHPLDTAESVLQLKETMETFTDLGAYCDLNITTPFPGTELYNQAEQHHIHIQSRDWDKYNWRHAVFSTENFSTAAIEEVFELVKSSMIGYQTKRKLQKSGIRLPHWK